MKLCIDCKYFGGSDLCHYPQKIKVNPVSEAPRGPRFASIERTWSTEDSCAPEGRWFEPLPEAVAA